MAKLYFRYGAMNSGKSTALMQVAHNYEEQGMKVLILKPQVDTKGGGELVSRLGVRRKADLLIPPETDVFEAAEAFARVEGILPAPESSHAIRVAIDEALKCKETGEEKNIVFGLTGTGYFDMVAYEKYNDGKMNDYIPTDEELAESLKKLP